MNCQEFEAHTIDLARERLMDAGARQTANAHAESCARCAARLADERALTAGLARVAASGDVEEAPARTEALLLDAFRASRTSSLAPVTPHNAPRRLSLWWIAAAAAIIVIAFITALQLKGDDAIVEQRATQEKIESAPAPSSRPAPLVPLDKQGVQKEQPVVENVNHRSRRAESRRGALNRKPKPAATPVPQEATEIATEFISLTGAGSLVEPDGGQIVRVELPRAALLSFGLPMNMERADERIKADVIVGNDGLARAIRFVR
jgi:hypothetical protein